MQLDGLPAASHPARPGQDACGLPHGTQTACSQVGKAPACLTVNVVWEPGGDGITCTAAVTHPSSRQPPTVPPQSASVVQGPKRLASEVVTHRFSPVVLSSL